MKTPQASNRITAMIIEKASPFGHPGMLRDIVDASEHELAKKLSSGGYATPLKL